MRIIKVIAIISVLISNTVFAKAIDTDVPAALQSRAMNMVADLIEESFPQLKGVSITPRLIHSPEVFLATDIEIPSVLTGDRQYILYLNKRLVVNPISDLALKAILAHELVHFADYEKMNGLQLAVFYMRILLDKTFQAEYERATDLQTFELGYAIGIKAFRFWLYEHITPDAKKMKQINYFTPAEIDDWLLSQNEITLL